MIYFNLSDCAIYGEDRVNVAYLSKNNYISTENMLPDRRGICPATSLPNIHSVTKFVSGDILLSNIRPYFKKIWLAEYNGGCSNDVLVIRAKNGTDPHFLYYVLSDTNFFNYATATAKGTKMPRGSKAAIMKYLIPAFDLPTQEKIASILSAYDDAIENNNKRIKILEKMAENLYREWFVRMRFPGHETAEYENGLPKGWSVKSLKDFGHIETGKTPPTERVEFYLSGHIPFIKTPDMNEKFFTLDTEEKLTIQGSNSQRKKLIPKHSIMVSCIGSGGVVSVNSFASHTNQQINTLILNDMIFLEYMFFACKYLKSKILMYGSTGSTMTNLSKGKFEKLTVICPDRNTLLMYRNRCKDIFKAIENCSMLNMKLRLIRDILLPRLMVKNRGGNI